MIAVTLRSGPNPIVQNEYSARVNGLGRFPVRSGDTGRRSVELRTHEYVVRRVRFLRQSGEAIGEQKRIAKLYARHLALDWQQLLVDAAQPGPLSF